MTTSGPVGGDVTARLTRLADRLETELGAAVEVDRDDGLPAVHVSPRQPGACPFSWLAWNEEIVLSAGTGGCRWELEAKAGDVDFIEAVVDAIVAGRAVEVFAPGRSAVEVRLLDGRVERTSQAEAPAGCLPMPFWGRWGRRVTYSAYT